MWICEYVDVWMFGCLAVGCWMLAVGCGGCDCCTFTIKIVSFGIFALMDFLFIFLFLRCFFSVLSNDCLAGELNSNSDFESNSDLACLKCLGGTHRYRYTAYGSADTDTNAHTLH